MNLRPLKLTLTALSALVLCLALAVSASASVKRADVSAATATNAAKAYDFSGTPAKAAAKDRPAKRSTRSQGDDCGDTNALAGEISESSHARTTVCLLNRERTSRGLRPLSLSGRLSNAASAHNRDMVANRYFAHESRSGGDVVDRIRSTGYLSGAHSWMVGENLAWGSGTRSTPAAIVSAWMHSPGHRRNILTGRFREIGVGIDFRAPTRTSGAAVTYTTTFGARS